MDKGSTLWYQQKLNTELEGFQGVDIYHDHAHLKYDIWIKTETGAQYIQITEQELATLRPKDPFKLWVDDEDVYELIMDRYKVVIKEVKDE